VSDRILMIAQNATKAAALKRQNSYNSFVDVVTIAELPTSNKYKQIMLDEMTFTQKEEMELLLECLKQHLCDLK